MNTITYTGACLSGSVQYELTGDNEGIGGVTAFQNQQCRKCRKCRRWSGLHGASVHAPKSDLGCYYAITSGVPVFDTLTLH